MNPFKNIEFISDWRCFKNGLTIDFHPITILVGDQGVGKSSLIYLITNMRKKDRDKIAKFQLEEVEFRFFDFEKDNLRMKSYFSDKTFHAQIAMIFQSHGESNNELIETMLDFKNILLILDEPDTALSPRSILKFVKILKKVSKNNQIILSCHNPWLIESFDEVYSLEHCHWMNSKDFLESQKRKRK